MGLDRWSEASSSWMRGEHRRPEGGEAVRGSDSSAPAYVTEDQDHVTTLDRLWPVPPGQLVLLPVKAARPAFASG